MIRGMQVHVPTESRKVTGSGEAPAWELGAELRPSERAVSDLNC